MKRLTSLLAIAVPTVIGGSDAGLQKPHRALRGAAFCRRRMPIAHGIWLVALTVGLLTSSHRVLADDIRLTGSDENLADLVVLCPQGAEPRFKNQKTGETFPISDPRLRAIAKKACQSAFLGLAEPPSPNVNIVNETGAPIFVGFSGSSISWGSGCEASVAGTVEILSGGTCQATVPSTNTSTRFCANTTSGALDCTMAQQHLQTFIETNFSINPSSCTTGQEPSCVCFGQTAGGTCLFYDISVIPLSNGALSFCQNNTWFGTNQCPTGSTCPPTSTGGPQCAGAGTAAYNLPVMLSCPGQATFTCQGPATLYPPVNYPANCGMPSTTSTAQCIGNTQNCLNAFFYPMFGTGLPIPNVECPNGQPLTITFLSGP